MTDRLVAELGVDSLDYSDFISEEKMEVKDVIRPIYRDASKALGREFPYPGDQ